MIFGTCSGIIMRIKEDTHSTLTEWRSEKVEHSEEYIRARKECADHLEKVLRGYSVLNVIWE